MRQARPPPSRCTCLAAAEEAATGRPEAASRDIGLRRLPRARAVKAAPAARAPRPTAYRLALLVAAAIARLGSRDEPSRPGADQDQGNCPGALDAEPPRPPM